jgi:[ribosomal protein S5]-alanine N-acetyltransferase
LSIITTPRLILRELNADDAAFILELLNEADFVRFIGDKGVRNLADAKDYIRNGPIHSYASNGFGLYAASLRDGPPLGICGLVKRDGLDAPDLGFAFLARHRSKGYALEASEAVLERGRKVSKLPRILAITTPDNHRSIGLLEKAGFKFEGMITLNDGAEELNLFTSKTPSEGQ